MIADRCADLLEELEKLLRLNDENVFKVRAYEKAQQSIAGRADLEARARAGTLTEIAGIGKGIAEVLTEFILKGTSTARDELLAKLPPGLLELTEIPGLGPKKARTIINELGITSVGELEYACRENRLTTLKGFGEKAQSQILAHIEGMKSRQNKALYYELEHWSEGLLKTLRKNSHAELTGQLRRQLEIIDRVDLVVEGGKKEKSKAEKAVQDYLKEHPSELPIEIHMAERAEFAEVLFKTTASPEWLEAFGEVPVATTETEIFEKKKFTFIDPVLRETRETTKTTFNPKNLIQPDQIQGVFHNHTTRSDGRATADQMIQAAIQLGYKYIGLSDHSQSAFYAQGLKSDALKEQKKEIEQLREKYPEIEIFWGVESDILQDGSLDYPESQLKQFDFVVGSIHSRFKMDGSAMTERILRAIQNPYTSMIGHLTGRILLARDAYTIDFDKIFRSAAQLGVAIEINANPQRLDVDWRHGPALRELKVMTCINPDAHDTAGLADTRYGITVARKALLPPELVLNTRSADEVRAWLNI